MDLPCALLIPWFSKLTRGRGWAVPVFTWISVLSYSLYLCNMMAIELVGWFDSNISVAIPGPVNLLIRILTSLPLDKLDRAATREKLHEIGTT